MENYFQAEAFNLDKVLDEFEQNEGERLLESRWCRWGIYGVGEEFWEVMSKCYQAYGERSELTGNDWGYAIRE